LSVCAEDDASGVQAVAGQEIVGKPARLLDEEEAGDGIPCLDVKLAVAVVPTGRDVSQRQRT
jgi:hypothetical protein